MIVFRRAWIRFFEKGLKQYRLIDDFTPNYITEKQCC